MARTAASVNAIEEVGGRPAAATCRGVGGGGDLGCGGEQEFPGPSPSQFIFV